MAKSTANVGRPNNNALLALMAVLAALGFYTMRITTAMNDIPVGFLETAASGVFPNGVPIKKDYTGIHLVDEGLSFLVAAFLAGPMRWNEPYYWQQLYFLIQISALVTINNVEAYRQRNQNSWLKYISIWAFVYQNVGAACIVTIWWLLLHRVSQPKAYFESGRTVPLPYARVILPGVFLFYVVPTVTLFLPDQSVDRVQKLLAFWQFTPILSGIPMWLVSLSGTSTTVTASNRNADVRHLKVLYALLFVLCVATHWYAIRGISLSTDPDVTYARVFLPSTYTWKRNADWGLLFIFQWDWLIIGLMYIIPSWVAVCDVQRMRNGEATLENIFESFLVIAALTGGGGPGATLAAVWFWREAALADIEIASGAKKVQ
ncbi:hypothetical protein J4E85_005582 [Alternaria conjuncta]|uniref:uncharacterized protein n=1 Tax=Alternaria conjuncta TaxID=181017 RepID=UPI00221E97BA|nr:uncharacterized protein J4E85_005582 [Alternaria conjuncta]KAI4928960.1 hypothetical protein J4E85_005582 [Alternaria conjuncta]